MADGGHVCRRTGILFGTCTTRQWGEHSDQVKKRNPTSAQLGTEGNILTKLKKKSDQWSWRRCDNKKCLQTDRRTPDSSQTVRKSPLDYVQKSWWYQKGPSNLDSRYPTMPEPTGGLGGPLVPRPTGKLSSNTCPGNSNIPEYACNITC